MADSVDFCELYRAGKIQTLRAPNCPDVKGAKVTAEDWVQLGMLGNTAAMQWYALSHPGTSLPAPAPGGEIAIPGVRASFNTNLLIVGVLGLLAFVMWSK